MSSRSIVHLWDVHVIHLSWLSQCTCNFSNLFSIFAFGNRMTFTRGDSGPYVLLKCRDPSFAHLDIHSLVIGPNERIACVCVCLMVCGIRQTFKWRAKKHIFFHFGFHRKHSNRRIQLKNTDRTLTHHQCDSRRTRDLRRVPGPFLRFAYLFIGFRLLFFVSSMLSLHPFRSFLSWV